MPKISVETRIDAPKEKVWGVLADIGNIYQWNPGVLKSYTTSDQTGGEGATRHCDLSERDYLDERVIGWREGESLKIDVYKTNLPLKRNVVTFSLTSDGEETIVRVSPDYELKFGPLGVVMDLLMARRQLRNGMRDMLAGLKYHVETGELVGEAVPAAQASPTPPPSSG